MADKPKRHGQKNPVQVLALSAEDRRNLRIAAAKAGMTMSAWVAMKAAEAAAESTGADR